MPETTTSTGNAASNVTGVLIGLLVIFAIVAFFVIVIVKVIKGQKKAQKEYEKNRELWKHFQPVDAELPHAAGLPVPAGMLCSLHLTERGLAISASGNDFNIAIEKITSITSKTDTEIQKSKQYVSSAGGAVAGAMMFGAVGAMIGGRVKEKDTTVKTETHYMVITYKKDDSIDYLLFELPLTYVQAISFEHNFELLTQNRPSETIEL